MDQKKIILFGFYGRRNTGDDAMLYGIVNYLSLKTDAEIIIPTDIPTLLPEVKNKITLIPRSTGQILKGVTKADYLFVGGGSLFHTKGTRLKFKIMVSRILFLGIWAKVFGCKVAFISAGIGPFDNSFGRLSNKLMVKLWDFINVRDEKSFQLVSKENGLKKLSKCADFAYAIDIPQAFKVLPQDNSIAINLLPYYTEYLDQSNQPIIATFTQVINELLSKSVTDHVYLVCFNAEESPISGDITLLEELCSSLNDKRVSVFPYSTDPLELMKLIKTTKLFVTLRYHGIIYSHLMGVPCVAINYHTKCEMLVKELNKPQIKGVDISVLEKPAEMFDLITQQVKYAHFELATDLLDNIALNAFPPAYFK